MSSAEKGSHRGFKYVKGKSAQDTETVPYEEFEESKEERSARSKRKAGGSLSSEAEESNSAKKKRTSTSSASNTDSSRNKSQSRGSKAGASSRTATVQKHQYPAAPFELSEDLVRKASKGKNHGPVLLDLLEGICEAEMDSLAGYLQSEDSRSLLGRQHILASLTDVLSRLGPEVQKNLSVGVEFNPEVTQADKVELRGLLETRAQLQQHSEKLSAYLADVSVLAADHDLWLGAKVEDTLKKRREDSSESSAALETAQQYLQILENLDAHCAQVLSSTERTREAVALGTKASDRLFKAFKKARDEGLSSKAPKDTKELLRKLPNLF